MEIVVALLLAALLALWVYQDARSRGERQAGAWAAGVFLLAIVVLPLWLIKRPAKGAGTTRRCPYCAEEVQKAATICRFCSREIEPMALIPDVAQLGGTSKGFKWVLGIAFGLFALVIVAAMLPSPPSSRAAGAETAPTGASPSAAPSTSQLTTWTPVASWSGSGIKETETFLASSREWRIKWETKNEVFAGAGILQVMVYSDSGSLVTLAANKQGTGSDVSYVRSGPGRHYLTINSANVDWQVTVEDQRSR